MHADRIAQMIGHACEIELRELAAYMGSLTQTGRADLESNPLRAETLGAAIYRAIEAASGAPESAQAAGARTRPGRGQGHARVLRADPGELQAQGIQPVALTGAHRRRPRQPPVGGQLGLCVDDTSTRSQTGDLDTPLGHRLRLRRRPFRTPGRARAHATFARQFGAASARRRLRAARRHTPTSRHRRPMCN